MQEYRTHYTPTSTVGGGGGTSVKKTLIFVKDAYFRLKKKHNAYYWVPAMTATMNSKMKSLAESEKAVITFKAARPNSSPHQCNMF